MGPRLVRIVRSVSTETVPLFAYITRRVLATIPLLIIALYVVFVGVSLTRDPLADFYLCLPRCQDGFDRITEVYNLDVPILIRPFVWFGAILRGDLGDSSALGEPVWDVIKNRGWNTAILAIPAFLISAVIALTALGVLGPSPVHEGRLLLHRACLPRARVPLVRARPDHPEHLRCPVRELVRREALQHRTQVGRHTPRTPPGHGVAAAVPRHPVDLRRTRGSGAPRCSKP